MPRVFTGQIQLKDGINYLPGEPWPEAGDSNAAEPDPDRKLVVGPIFYRPSKLKTLETTEFEEDDPQPPGSDPADPIGEDTTVRNGHGHPACYVIWCVTETIFRTFMAGMLGLPTPRPSIDRQLLTEHVSSTVLTCRRVQMSEVAVADERWPADRALMEIAECFKEIFGDDVPKAPEQPESIAEA